MGMSAPSAAYAVGKHYGRREVPDFLVFEQPRKRRRPTPREDRDGILGKVIVTVVVIAVLLAAFALAGTIDYQSARAYQQSLEELCDD